MLKVGSKFYTFDDLSRRLEEFQEIEQVQLWVRDSRTVVAAAKRARRKSLNPALKYAELTYSCVFGGRRPSDQAKTHNQTSAGGCPFKVRLSTSNDGQALVVKEICHDHNHEPGKKLHEEPRRLYKNKANNRAGVRKPVRYLVNKQRTSSASSTVTCLSPKTRLPQPDSSTTIRLAQSPFHHLQLHSQQQQQQIKLQLEQHLQQQRIRQQQLDVVQLDSPDHIDTPDHLSSPDLSSSFEQLGNIITTTDQYSYLPPSPISPSSLSSSGQTGYSSEEEESVEPILDLDVALEEALGDLDSVSSMDLEDKFALHPLGARTSVSRGSDCEPSLSAVPLAASPSTSATASHHHSEDPCAPPPAKRFRGRPRKQSFTAGNAKSDDENETDFIGFSPVKTLDSAKGEQINEIDIAEADAMAKQLHVYKLGITFVPGAKLEVLDSRDNNWYQCKVVEVDWGELDILVHFERWSVRYDEWLKMDSTRIRPLSRSKEKGKPLTFKIGEKVLGYWAPDSKYYLGQITKHSSEDYYEVLFYDGYTKSLRTSQLRKIANPKQYSGIDIKASPKHLRHLPPSAGSVVVPAPAAAIADVDSTKARRKSVPAVPFESPPVSPASAIPKEQSEAGPVAEAFNLNIKRNIFDVEILEKKRKTKRKPDVEQVFKSIKKKRKLEEMTEAESQSFPIKTLSPSKSKVKLVKKEASLTEEAAAPPPRSLETQIFPNSEGMPSKSCNYFEVDIGHGWKKVCNRRTHGIWMGKWDVFFIASDGRKLRNRQELIKYCEENPGPLKPSDLDFSVRSAKQIYDATRSKQDSQIRQEIQSDEEMETKPSTLKSPAVQTVDDDEDYDDEDLPDDGDDMVVSSSSDESDESADSEQKVSVKDVVKKRQTSSSESDTELESSPEKQDVSSVKLSQLLTETMKKDATHYKVEAKPSVISPVKDTSSPTVCPPSETKLPVISRGPKKEKKECTSIVKSEIPSKSDHSHKCPSKSCEKSFRKENLLQMHMKHYHPEFLKRRSLQAPNVADLAYARTVGDHLDVASQSPSSIAFPPIDFMIPEKKTEVVKKTKSSEQKKIVEKKGGGKRLKDGKRDKSLQDEASDSDEGDNNGEELTTEAKEEEDSTCVGKSEAHRPDPNLIPKTKPSRRFQRERTVSRSETTKRRSRKSESMSEDDPVEKKLVKIRSSKHGQSESIDPDEENTETWTEAPTEDYQDAIIHCGCNSQEEDGLMLQCDVCLTWQHGNCYNIESEDQVPEKYICFLCENPKGQRSSMRFRHHQEWLKEGKLPRFSFSTSEPNVKLESCIRRGHELSANVLQLSQLIYSLRLKLNIAKEADHPKFVMWHKKWEEPNDDLVDTENKLSDSKSNQNVTDHQLAPIHELISSLSQSETQPESQISYQAQTKSTTISFSAEPASSAPVSTTSKGDSAMSEILETIGVSRIDDVSALVEREKILKEEPLPSKESNTPETKSSEGSSNDSAKNQIASLPSPKHETTNLKLELTEELPKSTKTEPNEKEEPLNVETSKKEHRTDNKGEIHKQLLEHVVPSDLKTAEEDPSIKEVKSNVAKQQGKKELDHNFPSKVSEGDLSVKDSSSAGENNDKVSEPSKASGNAEITTLSKDEKVELIKKETDIPLEQRKVEKTEDSLKVVDGGSQDSLEDPEDLALALGALGAGAETNINDGLVDLLSSNPEFVEQLVVGSELAPLVPNNVNVQPVPIIPKNERIEPVNCKLNLLQHVDVLQNKVMKRFDYIEDQLKALEAEMNLSSEISREEEELLASDGDEGRDPVTLQARTLVKLILNDLDTVKRISDFSDS